MFLKGFGPDQCEKDATEGSNPIARLLRSNHPIGAILCKQDVAKQPPEVYTIPIDTPVQS